MMNSDQTVLVFALDGQVPFGVLLAPDQRMNLIALCVS